MATPLNLLLAEDSTADAELLVRALQKAGFEPSWQRVDNEEAFAAALQEGLDLVISDYQMPQFTGLRALAITRARYPGMPFIIVSGTIGEETAVEAMRLGATDYLLKDRLFRLGPAITRALAEARERRERELREQDFGLLFAQNPLPMWVYDCETLRFLAVNEAAIRHYGYTREEFLDRTLKDIRPPEDVPRMLESVRNRQPGVNRPGIWRHLRKDGTEIMVETTAHRTVFQGRTADLVLANDVTERIQSEEQLRLSELKFSYAFANNPAAIALTRLEDGKVIEVNDTWVALTGYSREEMIGLSARPIWPSPAAAAVFVAELRAKGVLRGWEEPFRKKSGEIFTAALSAQLMTIEGETVILSTLVDITARKQAEEALRASQQDFQQLFARNPMPMWVYDLETLAFLAVNDAAVRHYGYQREEFLRMTILDIRPPGEVPALLAELSRERVLNGPTVSGFWRHRKKSGEEISVEITVHALTYQGRRAELILSKDVTEQTRSLLALQESEARFRQVVETIEEVFWMTDEAKHQVLYISPGYEKVWGRSRESIYQSSLSWVESIHPDDRERILQAAREKQARGEYDEEYRIVRPDGSIRWIRDRAFPVREADGRVYRITGVAVDISERKLLEEQFLRAQRLEAIGTLASGVAHDLNNILSPVLLGAGLLLNDSARLPEQSRRMLTMIEGSAKRGSDIVRQLLTFGRGLEGVRLKIDARHLLKDMVRFMQETFPRNIRIEGRMPATLWPIVADPTQVHQVLLNLCVNARDAMPDGGQLTVTAANQQVDEKQAAVHSRAKPGDYIAITITDTGHGIPPEIIGRIFDPFFTTKGVGKGTGLGLSTVIGIVNSHGGFVLVDSAPGRGTSFRVFLPGAVGEGSPESADAPLPQVDGEGELILVVDDEAAIRDSMGGLLEACHYRTLKAASGDEALQLARRHRDTLRVVVTDMMMPGMDGLALIRALRAEQPTLKIIACSGLDHDRDRQEELNGLGVAEILAKPFAPAVLLRALGKGS